MRSSDLNEVYGPVREFVDTDCSSDSDDESRHESSLDNSVLNSLLVKRRTCAVKVLLKLFK